MDQKVGEIFEFGGEWYQCINPEKYGCSYCDLQDRCMDGIEGKLVTCHARYRSDEKCVVFKKLEKLGDPFERNGYFYQEYKAHTFPLLMNGGVKLPTPNGFAVLIKQNKEDMEEQKIQHYDCFFDREPSKSNLKPFSLEAAKAGKPVCTRDGRKVRIICFDRNDLYPIVALIECEDGKEIIGAYSKEGQTEIYEIKGTNLMMLPEKKEGWVNIVRGSNGKSHMGRGIFQSKEEAEDAIKAFNDNLIDTIKVSWEE